MSSNIINSNTIIGVVIHDAGGAEVITSYLKNKTQKFLVCAEGPAVNILKKKIPNKLIHKLDIVLANSDVLLCGTSYPSNLEFTAIKQARALKKPCISVLDHWVNYKKRFLRLGELVLPDQIWVLDNYAKEIAKKKFPYVSLKQIKNPYLLEMEIEFNKLQKIKKINRKVDRILYLTEHIGNTSINLKKLNHHDVEVFDFLIKNIKFITKKKYEFTIRVHPKEFKEKYNIIHKFFDAPVIIDNNTSLIKQIATHDIIVGCATMAMVVGLACKKRVISCIPPNSKIIPLPHKKIVYLKNLVKE